MRCVYFLLIICIISLLIAAPSLSRSSTPKVDSKIMEILSHNPEARVIITLNPSKLSNMQSNALKDQKSFHLTRSISGKITKEQLSKLETNPYIQSITLDQKVRLHLADSVPLINATAVHSTMNITGKGQTVCILDTGADYTHPDLGGCFGDNCKILAGHNMLTGTADIMDDNGHGTHVAGIVAANGTVKGVAPEANLAILKVLDSQGGGYVSDIDAGMEWCIENAKTYNITAITMSFGTETLYSSYCNDELPSTSSLVSMANQNNISVIASTGNDRNRSAISAPACISSVIAVGGTTKSDALYSDGNRNILTDLLAPSQDITSTYPGGYASASGTSMASPHVAGAIALLNQYKHLTPVQSLDTLRNHGKNITDSSTFLNFTRIDIYSALLLLMPLAPSINITKINLTSPSDYFNTSYTNLTFACSASGINISNITLYLTQNNSFQPIQTLTPSNNSATFTFSNIEEGKHEWNCLAADVQSKQYFSEKNNTLTIDLSSPSLTLISPLNLSVWTSGSTVTFAYEVSDLSLANCTLNINNNPISTTTDSQFSISLTNGVYNWGIGCEDQLGHKNISETRTLTVNYIAPSPAPVSSPVSSGGGGGGGGGGSRRGNSDIEINLTNKINPAAPAETPPQITETPQQSIEIKNQKTPTGGSTAQIESKPQLDIFRIFQFMASPVIFIIKLILGL